MAQRFIRCQLCGMPHPAEERECPVHHRPIVPARRVKMVPPGGVAPAAPAAQPPVEDPPPALASPTADAPLLGRLLEGRYRVCGVIAAGGMGVVYDAVHVGLGRRVAIKSLHRKYVNDSVALARFQHEALVVGRLGHPNIVEVYDMGTLDDETPYLVMERLDGETVTQRLERERPMRIPAAVDIAAQVLSALVATHAREVLHRDLKPDNVFLVRREGLAPVVKVLDFGIAVGLTDDTGKRFTRSGFVMGTPAYMSPEQARGERGLDVRTDLYSVGMILYEMLTGRLPFASRVPQALLGEIQRVALMRPRLVRPEISAALDAQVMRALARDREQRFPDAAAMLRALQALVPSLDDGRDDPSDGPGDDPTEVSGSPDGGSESGSGSQAIEVFERD